MDSSGMATFLRIHLSSGMTARACEADCARSLRLLKKAQQPWHRSKKVVRAPPIAPASAVGKKDGLGASSSSSGKIAMGPGGSAGDCGPCAANIVDDSRCAEMENSDQAEDRLS
jgi:hypothetical protein